MLLCNIWRLTQVWLLQVLPNSTQSSEDIKSSWLWNCFDMVAQWALSLTQGSKVSWLILSPRLCCVSHILPVVGGVLQFPPNSQHMAVNKVGTWKNCPLVYMNEWMCVWWGIHSSSRVYSCLLSGIILIFTLAWMFNNGNWSATTANGDCRFPPQTEHTVWSGVVLLTGNQMSSMENSLAHLGL